MRIWVEAKPAVIIGRRCERDEKERKRTLISILHQLPDVINGYEQHIKPKKKEADLVIKTGALQ